MEEPKNNIEQYVVYAVRRERMAQNVSQSMLAFGIGVSRGFIGQVENPRRRARYNIHHINEIARYLCVSPRVFFPEKAFEQDEQDEQNK